MLKDTDKTQNFRGFSILTFSLFFSKSLDWADILILNPKASLKIS